MIPSGTNYWLMRNFSFHFDLLSPVSVHDTSEEKQNISPSAKDFPAKKEEATQSGSIAALTEVKWIKRLTCWTCWNKKSSDHYQGSPCKMTTAVEGEKKQTFKHG